MINRRDWLKVGALGLVCRADADELSLRRKNVETTGIGQHQRLERHDPSNIIRYRGKYYLWYTEHPPEDGFIDTYVQCATSPDGYDWTVQGTALDKGGPSDPDALGALTSYVVPHDGRFYMFYTRVPADFVNAHKSLRGIGYAVADTPNGPWRKQPETILWPGEDSWDNLCCDDANLLYRDGKWWLYYKGRTLGDSPRDSQVGVAIADKLAGPYRKHSANPLFKGHAFAAWNHDSGVAAMSGDIEKPVIYRARDGINFDVVAEFDNKSVGLYCPDNFPETANGTEPSWGFDVARTRPRYIYRFDLLT